MKLLKLLCLFEGGAAGLFALTTCTSAAFREKDDPGNWALGGIASGALFGLRSEYMQHFNNLKSRLSLIVWVNVVLNRTVVVDSD